MKKTLVSRYEIISIIGHGVAGSVYLAYDSHLQYEVAIKKLNMAQKSITGSLRSEVNILKQMEHEALPIVYDFFAEAGSEYMAMEYVRGISLADYVKENGPLGRKKAILLMKKLLSVFEYLHSFNPPFIYRDLKPENIMLKSENEIKLVDFGTAFSLYSETKNPVKSGTPGFTAPELFAKGRVYNEASDIYSLGAVFYFILTGVVPKGKLPNGVVPNGTVPGGVVPNGKLPSGQAIAGQKRKRGNKIISRCLNKNPEQRYQNVHQLKTDLFNWGSFAIGTKIKSFIAKMFPLLLSLSGLYLIYRESLSLGMEVFIKQGDIWRWNEGFPLNLRFFAGALMVLAGLYFRLALRRKVSAVKIVKSICLTDKKTLWILSAFLLIFAITPDVYAVNDLQIELPIILRDHDGYKLLVKNGAVYHPGKDIIIEIPLDKLPQGIELVLKVVVEAEEMVFESRELLVMVE
ncbi:MAG: serine/threonine protein kinase [Lachnospiraceae bacterium]|nr:serine/threonine protein kinase [Lachnospiraceae bacterium]